MTTLQLAQLVAVLIGVAVGAGIVLAIYAFGEKRGWWW